MKPVQFCTNFIVCTILHMFHVLCNFAQVSYFAQFCTIFIFCTICTGFIFYTILHRFHILCNFAQVSYFVQFCTCFIFCSLQENATAKFDYQSRLSHIKMDNIKLSFGDWVLDTLATCCLPQYPQTPAAVEKQTQNQVKSSFSKKRTISTWG